MPDEAAAELSGRRRPAVSNHALQRAVRTGAVPPAVLAGGGNHAMARLLQRHPGKEKLTDPHDASAHTSDEDRLEHTRREFEARREQESATQEGFDDLTSTQFTARLTPLATPDGTTLAIALDRLPPKLQMLVRRIHGTLTELETQLAGPAPQDAKERNTRDEALRAQIKTGARSWHDSTAKIPLPKNDAGSSPRAQFFADWRKTDREADKDVPTKQQKNREKRGETGGKYPLREYTAVGWQEGGTLGRLIYDPYDDVIYLSIDHYRDPIYFKIVAPRTPGGGAAAAAPGPAYMSEWDLDLVVYEAYQELAAQLEAMAAYDAKSKAPPNPGEAVKPDAKRDKQLQAMSEDARTYLGVLYDLRQRYAIAVARAKEKARLAKAKADAPAVKTSKAKKGKASKPPAPEYEPASKEKGSNVAFPVFNHTFWVNSEAGFIGYDANKTLVLPNYTNMTIGELARIFRACVDTNSVGKELHSTALMLAGLVAEPSRHPVAALEALLAVIERSPMKSETRAFGTALPMAGGGTIATGGIALEVMLREAEIGRLAIVTVLAAHLKLEEAEINAYLFDLAARSPGEVKRVVMDWLFAVLMPQDQQSTVLQKQKKRFAPRDAPAETESAGTAEEDVVVPAGPGTPPQTIVLEFPENLQQLDPSLMGEHTGPSRWTQMASNYDDLEPDPFEPLTPYDVLHLFETDGEYEYITSFWVAYEVFRQDHPEHEFALSPIQVINFLRRRPPTGMAIMSSEDWQEYETFKREHHGEFVFTR